MAMKNESYEMIAILSILGLSARDVWGTKWKYFELRNIYLNDEKYGLTFANKYFGASGKVGFPLHLFEGP